MTRIVGVHGIGNHAYYRRNRSASAAAGAISQDWAAWLRAGLAPFTGHPGAAGSAADPVRFDLNVAYYAHLLSRGTPQGGDDLALLEPDAQDLLVTWVDQLRPCPAVALGPRTARARQAADWLTRRLGPAACLAAIAFCREIDTYLSSPDGQRRVAARQAVTDAITAHRPRVVIAHSFGSVVTYEALWNRPDLRVDLLLTLGSPLGMSGAVFDRLQPAPRAGRGAPPPGVAQWVNLADVGDIVAIPRDLPARFDGIAYHTSDLHIGAWDFHTVRSYLTCPETVSVLRPYLS